MKAIPFTTLLSLALLTAGASAATSDKPVSLKETFKDHFLLGTAVNRSMVTGGAGFRRTAEQNAKDVLLVKEQFNQITAENDMKMYYQRPSQGTFDFAVGDKRPRRTSWLIVGT